MDPPLASKGWPPTASGCALFPRMITQAGGDSHGAAGGDQRASPQGPVSPSLLLWLLGPQPLPGPRSLMKGSHQSPHVPGPALWDAGSGRAPWLLHPPLHPAADDVPHGHGQGRPRVKSDPDEALSRQPSSTETSPGRGWFSACLGTQVDGAGQEEWGAGCSGPPSASGTCALACSCSCEGKEGLTSALLLPPLDQNLVSWWFCCTGAKKSSFI